jgi:Xaa-Pro aminopeptidase
MNEGSNSSTSEELVEVRSHDMPIADELTEFMKVGWSPSPLSNVFTHPSSTYTKNRRISLSKKYPGIRLVFPAGSLKVRSNDTDYPFRAHSVFSWLTGITAADSIPNSILVMEPNKTGHEDLLFTHSRSNRDNDEFYKNSRSGEFWVGSRISFDDIQSKYKLMVRQIESIDELFSIDNVTLIVRGVDKKIDHSFIKTENEENELLSFISKMQMVKDDYEINEIQKAVDATVRGFADMVRIFPVALSLARGERVIESAFYGRARLEGNGPGYSSIVAAGSHACVLHWIKNDGAVLLGDLVLIDAGVEVDSHYTADITRTFPVNGKFSEAQRKIYMIVYQAQQAGIAAVKPGARFKDFHNACMEEIAKGASDLGVLPISFEESIQPRCGLHRRWQFHGSGHHLGIDVHDCAHINKEQYADVILEPGMILTVEPGFYIQPDDTLFSKEYRGIGIRIEDDILVTQSGCKILSNALPRHPDEVEAYMKRFNKNTEPC